MFSCGGGYNNYNSGFGNGYGANVNRNAYGANCNDVVCNNREVYYERDNCFRSNNNSICGANENDCCGGYNNGCASGNCGYNGGFGGCGPCGPVVGGCGPIVGGCGPVVGGCGPVVGGCVDGVYGGNRFNRGGPYYGGKYGYKGLGTLLLDCTETWDTKKTNKF